MKQFRILFSTALMACLLVVVSCNRPEKTQIKEVETPKLPDAYGAYLLSAQGWARLEGSGANSAATSPPQILIFSQSLLTRPFNFDHDAYWQQAKWLRSTIFQLYSNGGGDPRDPPLEIRKEESPSWYATDTKLKLNGKPVVGRNDMLILSPESIESNSKILFTFEEQSFTISIGSALTTSPSDRWLSIRTTRPPEEWARLAKEGGGGGGGGFTNFAIDKDIVLPGSHLDNWSQNEEAKFNQLPQNDWEARSKSLNLIESIDAAAYKRLSLSLTESMRTEAEAVLSEFPSVPKQMVAKLKNRTKYSNELLAAVINRAEQEQKKRESEIESNFRKALAELQGHSNEDLTKRYKSYFVNDDEVTNKLLSPQNLEIKGNYISWTERLNGFGPPRYGKKTKWVGDFSTAEMRPKEMQFLGNIIGEHRDIPIHPLSSSWHSDEDQSSTSGSFIFVNEADRLMFLKDLVDTRLRMQGKANYGFVTKLKVPDGYFSHGIFMGNSPWKFHCEDSRINSESIVYESVENASTNDQIVKFKSLAGRHVEIVVERNAFELSPELKKVSEQNYSSAGPNGAPKSSADGSKENSRPNQNIQANDESTFGNLKAGVVSNTSPKLGLDSVPEFVREHFRKANARQVTEQVNDYADVFKVSRIRNSKMVETNTSTKKSLLADELNEDKLYSAVNQSLLSDVAVKKLESTGDAIAIFILGIDNQFMDKSKPNHRIKVKLVLILRPDTDSWKIVQRGTEVLSK